MILPDRPELGSGRCDPLTATGTGSSLPSMLLKGFPILLSLMLSPFSAEAQPRLSYETTAVDLGEVWEGETLQVVFPVRNLGDAALRLKGG